jgi:hypothetical protein
MCMHRKLNIKLTYTFSLERGCRSFLEDFLQLTLGFDPEADDVISQRIAYDKVLLPSRPQLEIRNFETKCHYLLAAVYVTFCFLKER